MLGSERDSLTQPAMRPVASRVCIVMVCADTEEADQIGRLISDVDGGCLVTYRRAEDLMLNAPAGQVALVILAANDEPARLARTLQWLRQRWPRCPITVVGDEGGGKYEMVAREGSAIFLTRPVSTEQWSAILDLASQRTSQGANEGTR